MVDVNKPATAAAAKVVRAKKPADKKPSAHPTSAVMVIEAVAKLNEKGGSSLQAIKKYITEVHKADTEKIAPFIRKALKKAVGDGKLVQTKGTGAAGSFKLPSKVAAKPKPTATKPKSPTATKAKKAVKKATSPKTKKPAAAAAPKSPVKSAKPVVAAPKSPKPAVAAKKGKPKVTLPKVLPVAPAAEQPSTPVKKVEVEVAPVKPIPSPKKAAAPKVTKAKAPKTMKPKPAAAAKPKTPPTRVAPKRK